MVNSALLLTVCVCILWQKEHGKANNASKMLMKFTTGNGNVTSGREEEGNVSWRSKASDEANQRGRGTGKSC